MRNEGLGSWPARRPRITPRPADLVRGDDDDRTASSPHRVRRAARRAARPRRAGAATGSPTSAPTTPPPGDAVRLRAARRGLRPAQHPARRARDRLPARRLRARALVVHGPEHATADALRAGLPGVRHWIAPSLRSRAARTPSTERCSPTPPPVPRDEPVVPDDPCMIMYTSGTTGPAQGRDAHPRQHDLERDQRLVDIDLIADERALVSAPLFHIGRPQQATLTRPCCAGGTVVLVAASTRTRPSR